MTGIRTGCTKNIVSDFYTECYKWQRLDMMRVVNQ